MRKSDGSYTYFVPDVAYHLDQVGARLRQGDQHPGHRPPRHDRARARRPAGGRRRHPAGLSGLRAAQDGHGDERGGEEVKISKRAGSYVTLRDLIEWTSRDAVRFFLHQPQGRHRVHLRRRPGAQAQRREPGLLRAVRARAHLLGAARSARRRAATPAGARRGRPGAADRAERDRAAAQAGRLSRGAGRAPPTTWRRTTSRSTCATWRPPSTATTPPSASWSTTRRWRARAWRCWRRRARCCATRSRVLGVERARAHGRERPDTGMKAAPREPAQRGGFLIGLVVGLLIGLALALGVALYVTKAPMPFVNKVPQRTAEQDAAEAERNRNWDPNSALAGRNPAPAAASAVGRRAGGAAAAGRRRRAGAAAGPAPARRAPRRPRRGEPARAPRRAAPRAAASQAASADRRRRSVHLLRAGRRLRPQRGRRAAARQAGDARASRAGSPSASRPAARSTACASARSTRRDEADAAKDKLGDAGVDSALVAGAEVGSRRPCTPRTRTRLEPSHETLHAAATSRRLLGAGLGRACAPARAPRARRSRARTTCAWRSRRRCRPPARSR